MSGSDWAKFQAVLNSRQAGKSAQLDTRKEIVEMFMEVVNRINKCLEVEIDYWFQQYETFKEAPCFGEASSLLSSAGVIYSKKISLLESLIYNCKEKAIESEDPENETIDIAKQKKNRSTKAQRAEQRMKNELSVMKLNPKSIKVLPESKIAEEESASKGQRDKFDDLEQMITKYKLHGTVGKAKRKEQDYIGLNLDIFSNDTISKLSICDFNGGEVLGTRQGPMFQGFIEPKSYRIKVDVPLMNDHDENLPADDTISFNDEQFNSNNVVDALNENIMSAIKELKNDLEALEKHKEFFKISHFNYQEFDNFAYRNFLKEDNSVISMGDVDPSILKSNDLPLKSFLRLNTSLSDDVDINDRFGSNLSSILLDESDLRIEDFEDKPDEFSSSRFPIDLKSLDESMLNPTIMLTNLFPKGVDIHNCTINVENLQAMESSLQFSIDNSNIPLRELAKQVSLNILKIPDKHFTKRLIFSLPDDDFGFSMSLRKRKRTAAEQLPGPGIKLFKISSLDALPLASSSFIDGSELLDDEEEFHGFEETDILSSTMVNNALNDSLLDSPSKRGTLRTESGESGFYDMTAPNDEHSQDDSEKISDYLSTNDSGIGSLVSSNTLTMSDMNSAFNNTNETLRPDTNNTTSNINDTQQTLTNDTINETEDSVVNLESDDFFRERNEMHIAVNNWHERLKPILAKAKLRSNFDINELQQKIVNKFDENIEGSEIATPEINFEQVMEGDDSSFRARYFLSVLQMANNYNVQINILNKDIEKPTKPSEINLKLLSRRLKHTNIDHEMEIQMRQSSANASLQNDTDSKRKSTDLLSTNTAKKIKR